MLANTIALRVSTPTGEVLACATQTRSAKTDRLSSGWTYLDPAQSVFHSSSTMARRLRSVSSSLSPGRTSTKADLQCRE